MQEFIRKNHLYSDDEAVLDTNDCKKLILGTPYNELKRDNSFTTCGDFLLKKARFTALQDKSELRDLLSVDPAKALTKAVSLGLIKRWEIIPMKGQFSNLIFRVNSGMQLDLSVFQDINASVQKLSIYDVFVKGSDYFRTPLSPGVHVIFGPAGQGKSVFSKELAKRFKIPYFNVFESEEHSAITEPEIALSLRQAVAEPIAIVDSLRFIGMQATGFPALDKGINSGVFTFIQWLSTIAMRHSSILFVVVSTERTDEYIQQLYKDMLSGAVKSAYLLRGYGSGLAINRDNARSEWQPFDFHNNANWSFHSNSSQLVKDMGKVNMAYRLHGSDYTDLIGTAEDLNQL